jgi:hypothetical protein
MFEAYAQPNCGKLRPRQEMQSQRIDAPLAEGINQRLAHGAAQPRRRVRIAKR